MTQALTIRKVTTLRDKETYVNLLFKLYKGCEYWVPPIKKEEIKYLSPKHNPFMNGTECCFWIAYMGKEVVGRVGAIVHHSHNEKSGENLGRITGVEFIDNIEVADLLFKTAEEWLREHKMDAVAGPLGFSNLDHQGVLVEGFDQLQSVASIYHLPYYQNHFERLGYEKEIDWVEFQLNIDGMELPSKAKRISKIVKDRFHLDIKHFSSTKELMAHSEDIFKIMNIAFKELFSVVELNEEMISFYSKQYISLLNPKFVKAVITEENEIVGFTIGMPSMSEALKKANGRVFPFGILHILKAVKNPTVCDTLLTGMLPKYQATGAAGMLFTSLLEEMINAKVKYIETTGMLETNNKAIANWKNFKSYKQHKRKRCYRKSL